MADRCRFVRASASRLDAVESESVDVATTRSVLIYVQDKAAAFAELHRVLRPGGRIALFEPINSFGFPEPKSRLWGYDVAAIQELATRVRAVLDRSQATAGALTMTDFDERDLLGWTEVAGFETISVRYEVTITQEAGLAGIGWEAFLGFSPNPLCPTIGEALQEALDREERRRFEAHVRPLVERDEGINRGATVYLAATKGASRATGS